ncbi:AAA family ATPase [Branchiibius sp. NY16-3462-2]|uniref:AAA family ATPase n=1 Tax=Branchiibius sp. NY16-3462-2 TaxID=1807500 RepID=UPI00079AB226|nr:AAA family ATPase [Branchiibius sp. NY16-3462-2]KYH43193.1 ATP-binding protein [Branchiibius sp. NY16-3462-2]
MLRTLAIRGYRSLRDVTVPLSGLTVITGPNGSGKSSLYRAVRLLADVGSGRLIGSLAREGGLGSALWAGPAELRSARTSGVTQGVLRKGPISLLVGFGSDDFGYLMDLGLPPQSPQAREAPRPSLFLRDPEIKREVVFAGTAMRRANVLARRSWGLVEVADADLDGSAGWQRLSDKLVPYRSMLTEYADPARSAELVAVREQLRSWRFYDGFRADVDAPARHPMVGTRTPVLADDGRDLAAALQTIIEDGRRHLDATIDDAFPGSAIEIVESDGLFDIALHQPGMLRAMRAAELSDGTLRYLLWVAALLSPTPPPLLVINEPEASLHPSLLEPLARLIADAATRSQVIVVTHSAVMTAALDAVPVLEWDGSQPLLLPLNRDTGETVVEGLGALTTPEWNWGSRRS